jgi:capsular polysaccharide transport system permease protein
MAYYGLVAAPEFESTSAFTVRSADGGGGVGIELFIASVPGSSAGRDAMLVQEFVLSRDMLERLEADHGFVEHYRDHGDFLSRLASDAAFEERFDYYRDHVSVEHDSQSGVITLQVRAYSAEKAAELNRAMVAAGEHMVNDLNDRSRSDRIALAGRELSHAEARLTAARAALVAFQAEHDEINPLESAAALLAVRSEIEAELASARAELSATRRTLQPNAPEVLALRGRVAALQSQVDATTARLSNGETGFAATIAAFEPLMVEKEFAQRAYQSTLTALEMARVEADRQHRYVVTVASPSVPDAPTHPNGLRGVLSVAAVSFMLLGVGSLLLASVREHANL